ncbi:hypothetical protein AGMMS49975_09010 [Clostridia bacterium]|nr:hypothetical protein AGMMS49975_09010 [Clostridia bacterium]
MAIGIFRRPYTIRRRGEQTIVKGYAVSPSLEFIARLNIQPLSVNELQNLPEGERTIKRVKSFSADALISADEHTQTPGDLLFYDGAWYECKTCVHWLHTPLTHYESEFVVLSDQSKELLPCAGGDGGDD